jgi:hypothetical protein
LHDLWVPQGGMINCPEVVDHAAVKLDRSAGFSFSGNLGKINMSG